MIKFECLLWQKKNARNDERRILFVFQDAQQSSLWNYNSHNSFFIPVSRLSRDFSLDACICKAVFSLHGTLVAAISKQQESDRFRSQSSSWIAYVFFFFLF